MVSVTASCASLEIYFFIEDQTEGLFRLGFPRFLCVNVARVVATSDTLSLWLRLRAQVASPSRKQLNSIHRAEGDPFTRVAFLL